MYNFLKIITSSLFLITITAPIHAENNPSNSCLEKTAKAEALVEVCLTSLQQPDLTDRITAKIQRVLGNTYYDLDQFDAAIDAYKKAVKHAPNNWVHTKNLGWAYWEIDQYEEAISAFDLSLALSPKSITYRGKASSLRLLGRHDEALVAIKKALEIAPTFSRNMIELSRIHAAADDLEMALASIDAAILENPNGAYTWSHKGDVMMDLNDYDGAIKQYKMAVLIDPEKRIFHDDLAWGHWENGSHEDAIASFDAANAIENRVSEMGGKASSLSLLDRHEEALTLIDETLLLEPENVWNLNEKGWIYFRAENYDDAITAFNETLAVDENYKSALYGLSRVHGEQESYAKALEAINAALAVAPDVLYQGYHVFYLRKMKRYGAANTVADEYLLDNPNDYTLITQKMWVLQGIDRIDEAVTFIQGKIVDNPSDVDLITKFIGFLEEEERWHTAISESQKLIDMNEADHYNYRDLAFYYKKLGEFDACLKNAQTATDMEPDWEWGYYYTAECHLNNGDTSQAFEAIKASVLNGLDAMTRNEFAAELLGAGAPILAARLGLMRIR